MWVNLQHRVRTHVALFLAMAGAIFADGAAAQHIYWSDSAGIHRAKADGTDAWTLVPDADAHRLALDVGRGHIYWAIHGCSGWCTPWSPGRILRANLDGTELRTIIADHEFDLWAFAIDSLSMMLYWGGPNYGDVIWEGSLSSANYDGSDVRRILRGPGAGPMAIAVDPVDQVLYWSEFLGRGLVYAPVSDPSASAPVGSVEAGANDILVDASTRRLYWSEVVRIMRSDLDGSDAEVVVVTDTAYARGIALDPIAGKIYWRTGSGEAGSIRRANLDGTGDEIVLNAQGIRGLAVDPRPDGDFNMDGLVDLRDHVSFAECFGGPGSTPKLPQCAFFDLDPSDGDVDLADHAGFQNAMTGPL